jgi:DNA methylase
VVRCACPEGGLVVDVFGGSGTTAEAAAAASRRAIIGDVSPIAVATSRARLLRAGFTPTVERVTSVDVPRGVARAAVERREGGARVVLREPAMPLAWSVEVNGATWHAERTSGRADTVPSVADIAMSESRAPIHVRAWGDDGTLFELVLSS